MFAVAGMHGLVTTMTAIVMIQIWAHGQKLDHFWRPDMVDMAFMDVVSHMHME